MMNNYAKNAAIGEFLKDELMDAGFGGSDIQKTPVGLKITVFVTRPGLVIGRRGMGIRGLTERLEAKFAIQNPQIAVLEVETPELNPLIMCNRIASTVARGTAFRRVALWSLNSIMEAGALGTEIVVSGKLRSDRSHMEKYIAGVVPKSGEMADKIVREGISHARLKMGLFGIRIKIAIKEEVTPEFKILDESENATQDKSNDSEGGSETGSTESE